MSAPASSAPVPSKSTAVSYWSVVLGQLRKNRVAMTAWGMVKALVVVATAAPLLALNVPFLVRDGSGFSAPLLAAMFDRFLFPNGVDVFFNLLLVAAPVWTVGATLGRVVGARRGEGRGPSLGETVWAALCALVVVYVLAGLLLGARTAALLSVVVGGVGGALAFHTMRTPASRRAPARRLALVGTLVTFLAALFALNGPLRDTSPLRDWGAHAGSISASGEGWALFPPVRFHPDNVGELGQAPALRSLRRPDGVNLLGCDLNGRDVAARLLYGTRISLTIGLVAVAIYITIGVILGSLAGYYRGKTDLLIMRLVEVMICFPTMFLLLTIVAIFESRSIFLIMSAIGLVGWPGVTRLVRGEFLRQRNLDYVTAAKALGLPERRVIFGHLLPNCVGPVLVSATFGIAGAILAESGLAFLGLGDTTAPSWGQMLSSGRSEGQWHLIVAPGFAIFFVVTVFNLLGEGLRDALDPKLRR